MLIPLTNFTDPTKDGTLIYDTDTQVLSVMLNGTLQGTNPTFNAVNTGSVNASGNVQGSTINGGSYPPPTANWHVVFSENDDTALSSPSGNGYNVLFPTIVPKDTAGILVNPSYYAVISQFSDTSVITKIQQTIENYSTAGGAYAQTSTIITDSSPVFSNNTHIQIFPFSSLDVSANGYTLALVSTFTISAATDLITQFCLAYY